MELLAAMSIMTVVMTLATVGIVQLHRLGERSETRSAAQSRISQALLHVDELIRNASSISQPHPERAGQAPGWYVEILTLRRAGSTAQRHCVQLRVSGGRLQERTWPYRSFPITPTRGRTLASGITSARPFRYWAPGAV